MKLGIEFSRKLSLAYESMCKPLCHELKLPQTAFDILMFLANNPEFKTAVFCQALFPKKSVRIPCF